MQVPLNGRYLWRELSTSCGRRHIRGVFSSYGESPVMGGGGGELVQHRFTALKRPFNKP